MLEGNVWFKPQFLSTAHCINESNNIAASAFEKEKIVNYENNVIFIYLLDILNF